jgi:alkanesulfonate monooxygenase SsuD/methylene tetrahydromethanopterin reductase-like flavin-dependent oxidoreductase (luciferase family)
MEIGVLYDCRNPGRWPHDGARLYAQILEHAAACEAMGFDAVWLTEHHFIDDGYLPSCLTMAAAVASRTVRVAIGTAVLLLPLHDPIRIAEDAAVVDLISGGRLRLGFGLGYRNQELTAFGIDRASRVRRLEEGVEVVRRAWRDEPLTFHGRCFDYEHLDVTPKPAQRPGPPIWLAGRAPGPIARAARLGDGLIGASGHAVYGQYLDELRRLGKVGPVNLAALEFQIPSTDPERDAATLGPYAQYRSTRYNEWYGEAGDLESDRTRLARQQEQAIVRPERFFCTVDEMTTRLQQLHTTGFTSVIWFATLPGAPVDALSPNLELITSEVLPALRRSTESEGAR